MHKHLDVILCVHKAYMYTCTRIGACLKAPCKDPNQIILTLRIRQETTSPATAFVERFRCTATDLTSATTYDFRRHLICDSKLK